MNFHSKDSFIKRLLDLIFSTIILILFLPIGIIIIIILRFTGEGEIFYKQSRIGQYSEPFGLFKFVTMVKNSPNLGSGDITIKDDPRVLPFGKFLRKTKLNEFPQFINVLIGDMSLVGPRPLVKNQYEMIPDNLKQKIKNLKPGITGIGSIIFRNEEIFLHLNDDSHVFYREEIVPFKAKLECWYEENESLLVDSLLIIITIILVILPDIKIHKYFFSELPSHEIFNP